MKKNNNFEVCFAEYGKDEQELNEAFMTSCSMQDDLFINTAGMNEQDTRSMCATQYMKMRGELLVTEAELTEKQKTLPKALQDIILKRIKSNNEECECEEMEEMTEATQIAVFPDKYVPVDQVGTPLQDMRPINKEGYKIDDELKKEAEDSKLKNPQLQSVSPPKY